jgi:hypothetical protein
VHKKNLIPQAILPVNPITIQDLPTELVELSDEALSQVWGGSESCFWETQPIDGGYDPMNPIEPIKPIEPVYPPYGGEPFTLPV